LQPGSESKSGVSEVSRCITVHPVSAGIQRRVILLPWPSKHVPHFKPGKELRERVNGYFQRNKEI